LVKESSKPLNFAEMARSIDGFSGNLALTPGPKSMRFRVIWDKMSPMAIELIHELNGTSIFLHPASAEAYDEADRPALPLFSWSKVLRHPHWMPMIICKFPY
jgi:hypothetical protein